MPAYKKVSFPKRLLDSTELQINRPFVVIVTADSPDKTGVRGLRNPIPVIIESMIRFQTSKAKTISKTCIYSKVFMKAQNVVYYAKLDRG
jgi:hypothetical protein